jgi:nitrite transporter NirC
MIGIAGSVFLTIGGGWIAAVLFSIGLIVICARGYNLYTGKIGYIHESKDLLKMLVYLIGNFIGVFLVSLTVVGAPAATLVATKLAIPYWLLALKSIGCGFLMYLAVVQILFLNPQME